MFICVLGVHQRVTQFLRLFLEPRYLIVSEDQDFSESVDLPFGFDKDLLHLLLVEEVQVAEY